MTAHVKTDTVRGTSHAAKQARTGASRQVQQEVDRQKRDGSGSKEHIVSVREAAIDAALEMTFPASDPPSW